MTQALKYFNSKGLIKILSDWFCRATYRNAFDSFEWVTRRSEHVFGKRDDFNVS